ncbi:MAG: hypothetical protein OXN96_04505 [Bryobacterales bacterium]|nr:hypothetical protein [Bryobacterales bacterium]
MTERRAIGTFFYDMDKEITALEGRVDKNRAIKLGMMQQLLASSIRVPILDVPVKGWPVR